MSDLVGKPEDRFSRVAALIISELGLPADRMCSNSAQCLVDKNPEVRI